MLAGAPRGVHVLRVNAKDEKWKTTVICTVTVTVVYINDTVIASSTSVRLAGVFSSL